MEIKKEILKFDNYFFDLDGTIADSAADILVSLRETYRQLDLEFDESKFEIGPPIDVMLRILTPDLTTEMMRAIGQKFRLLYLSGDYQYTIAYKGVVDFLKKLKDADKKIFLATNKPMASTQGVLKKLGIEDVFIRIATPDFIEGRFMTKTETLEYLLMVYELDASKSIMFGDTYHDMDAAKDNKINTAAFIQGYGGSQFARLSGGDFVVYSYLDLLG